jgi:hypothetical protein
VNPLTKKLVWALAISAGLNLFLLGFGVARTLKPRQLGHKPPMHEPEHMGPGKALRFMGPHAPALRGQRRELLEAREAVAQALTREPFDREALAGALLNLRNVTAAGQAKLHEVLLETAEKLPRDEREQLARSKLLHDVPPKH